MDSQTFTPRKPLRLWPGVVALALQWLAWVVAPAVLPDGGMVAFAGAALAGLAIVVWWLFFSRAPWLERVGALALMVAGVAATFQLVHPSIATGSMGMMLPIYSIPVLSLALVAWAVASRGLSTGVRRGSLVAVILVACASFTLIRTGGVDGTGAPDLHWRWTPTPEERLLAQDTVLPVVAAPAMPDAPAQPAGPAADSASAGPTPETAAQPTEPASSQDEPASALAPVSQRADVGDASAPEVARSEWPGFRGPGRDSVVTGPGLATDWSRTPPVELWRRPVGPGWSSFAVSGDLVYTQEQRGSDEVVSCYRLTTGEPVWMHSDAVRFWESNAGPGPRATPTVHGGRVYAMGATGLVNALDARTGARVWSRDAAADTGATLPVWGFAGSPLVVGDLVLVVASGRLIAYDARSGERRWAGPTEGGGGYSSPHVASIGGVTQILLLRGGGGLGLSPADGAILWEHTWEPGASIVQPALVDGDVLLSGADMMGGIGLRRLAVSPSPSGWTVTERWTSRGLKPYFNDFVVHRGHAYGFDGSILAAVDLADGTRTWKGGRYGHGQMILLADQDVLVVLAEEGDIALVAASPDKHTELARVPAIEGKTWNHPALAGDVLLVRNGEEMAAFRLPAAKAPPTD